MEKNSKMDDATVGMFIIGDSVEREIDGLWFVGEIKEIQPPSNALDECMYSIFYNDIDNLEANVPESEIRLSEKSGNDDMHEQSLPSGNVFNKNNNNNNELVNNNNNRNNNNENNTHESKHGFSENDGTKESSYNQNIPNPPQSTTAKVVFHERDNNDDSKLQSTGTAYVLHGGMTDRSLNTGGSGLRAIRALRKK